MKKIMTILAAMVAVLSSCNKNEIESGSAKDSKDIILNISVNDPCTETKALIKSGWVADDRISIWFDGRTGASPDLVIKYDGSKWAQDGEATNVPASGNGYVKAVYSNNVMVASKDDYTVSGNTLTFSIANWKFLTEIQLVVSGLTSASASSYALACDKFTPCTGYSVGSDAVNASKGRKGNAVTGIANKDGVAFVFATADYSSSATDFKFTLTDNTSSPTVKKVYTATTEKVSGTSGAMTAIKPLKLANSAFTPAPLPADALKGEFSVSATKKIHFSKGNLIATIDASGAPAAWKFSANQFDCLGTGGANKTIGSAAGDIDLFGWSTAATSYGISTSESDSHYSGDFVEWGENIDDGLTWRTLSEDEWYYLLKTSSRMVNSKNCSSNAVSGVTIGGNTYNGVFIYPDNYNGDVVSGSMTWDDINDAGIVFLPTAGYRLGSSFIDSVGGYGYYWTSSAIDDTYIYEVFFSDRYFDPDEKDPRHMGCSVRLVTDSY